MKSLLRIKRQFTDLAPNEIPSFPGITWSLYCNAYRKFSESNNLSLVTFLKLKETTFIIPSDLEKAGWEELLKNYITFPSQVRYRKIGTKTP